jgi:gas vesicle protein
MSNPNPLESSRDQTTGDRGGFVALAVLAAALGAGAALMLAPGKGAKTRKRVGRGLRNLKGGAAETIVQLQREIRKRRRQSRRDKQLVALAGLFLGAGVTALLTPESGPVTRKRLGGTLSRLKVGAVDRIERLRQRPSEAEISQEDAEVRSVQDLGRDPNMVF